MPLYTADALILRTYKLAESDRIVVFLTSDRGKKRGVAKGARRPRSRFVGALETLTRVSVAYFERENRELVSLNYAEALRSPLALSGTGALGYVGYFAELLDEWAADADPNEKLYRLGAAVMDALAHGAPVEPLARYFEFWLLRLEGVYPSAIRCDVCRSAFEDEAFVEPRDRVLVCRGCSAGPRGLKLSAGALRFLRAAARTRPADVEALRLESAAGRELEAAHRALITVHLEKDLKSARVLREMQVGS
jgi:DNA repair protein RecO (recombination protein O)